MTMTTSTDSPLHPDFQRSLREAVSSGKIKGLAGQVVCFTGALSMTRDEMHALVSALGGQVSTRVDSHTTLLVSATPGVSATSKSIDAARRGIPVIGEKQFTAMLEVTDD